MSSRVSATQEGAERRLTIHAESYLCDLLPGRLKGVTPVTPAGTARSRDPTARTPSPGHVPAAGGPDPGWRRWAGWSKVERISTRPVCTARPDPTSRRRCP
ncbi:hypothetical protein CAE01nite_16690 [Cellulomonas aerilata]|uniref:Uncharacterized protein n=1 Tax=Cellulomonas aerilata TaxID=515326 RepID=A0A512DBT3_9CELL|nr:hypothetical protein CAE01nite_16690 [Cellulomonas aerilata]